jgi:hypothetical protein
MVYLCRGDRVTRQRPRSWKRSRAGQGGPPLWRRLARLTFAQIAVLVALIGSVHGLVASQLYRTHQTNDSITYTAPAHALLHGSYSTRLEDEYRREGKNIGVDIAGVQIPASARRVVEPAVLRTPGYPVLLALVGGGVSKRSLDALFVVQALLCGATIYLLELLVFRLWGPRPAVLAGVLYALDPFSKLYVALVLTEVLAGFLAVAALYAFMRAWERRMPLRWAAVGALVAMLVLVRPNFLFVLPLAAVVAAAATIRHGWRRCSLTLGSFVAAAAVIVGPWAGWTTSVVGTPVLTDWQSGPVLLAGAVGEIHPRTPAQVQSNRLYRETFQAAVRGEPSAATLRVDPNAHPRFLQQANARLQHKAVETYRRRLRSQPFKVASEILRRSYSLWIAHADRAQRQTHGALQDLLRLTDWITVALAAVGGVVALGRGAVSRMIVAFLILFTLVSATAYVEPRYSIPLRGVLLALAALAIIELMARARHRRSGEETAIQISPAGGGS